jgi:hypothetical protein
MAGTRRFVTWVPGIMDGSGKDSGEGKISEARVSGLNG